MASTSTNAQPARVKPEPTGADPLVARVRRHLDDILALSALAISGALCVSFRYLPMVDLPQHYAMVSILTHHADPAYGFAQRYAFDFVGRPYASVYWLGALLASVLPLGAAMRVVVAVCTVAPLAGTYALLASTRRPRFWVLLAVPFAFGSLWHWGFLNFLLGSGLFLGGLALVVHACRRRSVLVLVAQGVLACVLYFTHFHGLVMLLLFAPVFAWAYREQGRGIAEVARILTPLILPGIAAAAFVLLTWRQAEGSWIRLYPGMMERIVRFPEFLGGGLPEPWPAVLLVGFAAIPLLGFVLGGQRPWASRRAVAAFLVLLLAQVAMYFILPLNTNTATYVSARHALLCAIAVLPLLPDAQAWPATVLRSMAAAFCAGALLLAGMHLGCFDREARDFDAVVDAVPLNQRIAPLIFERASGCASPTTFPYLHFAAYMQARHGGELARSFAVVWNVPIRYRADYHRYPIREAIEWAPWQFSADDLKHFDYLLVRGRRMPRFDPDPGVVVVARSGAWTVLKNPGAAPAQLPSP